MRRRHWAAAVSMAAEAQARGEEPRMRGERCRSGKERDVDARWVGTTSFRAGRWRRHWAAAEAQGRGGQPVRRGAM
ncbi:hypothetical protein GUJ93_ZPchr0013g36993 [Zizania palustris]|uniref:Uncharacterized protein n=1 Tax=Zizania palustris TaxID=103762 RepID=A0A8J5WUK1_ZIZPA|nr:hypothetical protein GUJ93_ZPchr0013g36993 [Zizania palustris]